MKIIVAGATGFIGNPLVKRLLSEGHRVIVLSRRVDAFKNLPSEHLRVELWDGQNMGPWVDQMTDTDAVINLAGEGIADGRWSQERKWRIRASRLDATKVLVTAIARSMKRPSVLINASAIGYYGATGDADVTEASSRGKGFLADVCAEWENQALEAQTLGVRVVLPRLGVVLEKDGGALKKLIPPFQFYVGGPLGSGKQWFPWIHRADVVASILHTLQDTRLSGPVNVAAPQPLTMNEFCRSLGHAMNRPCWAPVPSIVLKLLLGEMSDMLLTGQRILPQRLRESGYHFLYPQVSQALENFFKPYQTNTPTS